MTRAHATLLSAFAMQMVLFIGIPAAGKSTFYRERFFDTHMRINLDMLKTRHREWLLFVACLEAKQKLVVDNTNLTRSDRNRYIDAAAQHGFQIVGYYFRSVVAESRPRNLEREADKIVPDKGLLGAAGRLEAPSLDEGFDALYYVRIVDGSFSVQPWEEEL